MSILLALLYVVIGAAVVVAIFMGCFVRRHAESVTPAEGWRRTEEAFVDPTTNRRMRVWIDPVDGSRHYVEER